MKILILNGSPKSQKSVKMHSIRYIEQTYKEHEFQYVHIIKKIKKYEEYKEELENLCKKVKETDAIIWAFPLYYALVPSHYKKFIELIFENNFISYFSGKYTSAFSTSIHYADIHAHNYIRAICEDLDMNYVEYLSHEMMDLTKENRRLELKLYYIKQKDTKLAFISVFIIIGVICCIPTCYYYFTKNKIISILQLSLILILAELLGMGFCYYSYRKYLDFNLKLKLKDEKQQLKNILNDTKKVLHDKSPDINQGFLSKSLLYFIFSLSLNCFPYIIFILFINSYKFYYLMKNNCL